MVSSGLAVYQTGLRPTLGRRAPGGAVIPEGLNAADAQAPPGSSNGRSRATPDQPYANFDYIRLAAAATVIFSHAYLLAYGDDAREPFVRLLGEGNILGIYGVFTFFIISGFLITQSACNAATVLDYAWHRVLRIFPALAACVFLSAYVLGTVFTSEPKLAYLTSSLPLKYTLYSAAVLPGSGASIPTVRFYAGGWSADWINGSLWTIPQELACYVIVGALMLARQVRWWTVLGLACTALFAAFLPTIKGHATIANFIYVAPCFAIGSLAYFAFIKGWLRPWLLAPCAAVAAGAVLVGKVSELFPVFAAYPLIWAATAQRVALPSLRRVGDLSYGMYLYGWPVEQVWRAVLGAHAEWWQLFTLSLASAAGLGFLSWRLVERRSLRLKRWRLVILREAGGEAALSGAVAGSDRG
jgi:peptidoglycan/LPS O-acetylase OafA/YrhL